MRPTRSTSSAITEPTEFGALVRQIWQKVEKHGRDPDAFRCGVWVFAMIHDNPDVVDAAFATPMMRYFAGIFGRLDGRKWYPLGHMPYFPDDWTYHTRWTPFSETPEDVQAIVNHVSPQMARHTAVAGSLAEVTARVQEFVAEGASFVGVIDMVPLTLGPQYFEGSMEYGIAIAHALKVAMR